MGMVTVLILRQTTERLATFLQDFEQEKHFQTNVAQGNIRCAQRMTCDSASMRGTSRLWIYCTWVYSIWQEVENSFQTVIFVVETNVGAMALHLL